MNTRVAVIIGAVVVAIAVIGGLIISMALSLIVTPVVYYLLTRSHATPA